MDALIRKATVNDAEQIAAVLNGVIAEGVFTLFDRPFTTEEERAFIATLGPRSALFVAQIGQEIAGVQSIDLFSNLAHSTNHVATMGTWLRGDFRGRGIGRRLAAESFRFADANGYTKIVIHVLADNELALRFYRGLGFADIGVARKHVRLEGKFHDEVYLEMLLNVSK
jgi:L-amino acid N-acyltransferase YncA